MDFTILAVVLLIGVGVPVRNKLIQKYRDKKKQKEKYIRVIYKQQRRRGSQYFLSVSYTHLTLPTIA